MYKGKQMLNNTQTAMRNAITTLITAGYTASTANKQQKALINKLHCPNTGLKIFKSLNAGQLQRTTYVPFSSILALVGKQPKVVKTLTKSSGWAGLQFTQANVKALVMQGAKANLQTNAKPHPQCLTAMAMGFAPIHIASVGLVAFIPINPTVQAHLLDHIAISKHNLFSAVLASCTQS
tara:strand:- start:54652 stop:55188 length:537 start_codon:yes stop_codon:yes gene_type:complete